MTKSCADCGEVLTAAEGSCPVCNFLSEGDRSPTSPVELKHDEIDADFYVELSRSRPPAATELPARLAPPLKDPIRKLRYFYGFLLIFGIGLVVLRLLEPAELGEERQAQILDVIKLGCVSFFLFSIWRLLPNRRTTVVYLRSFRHDAGTGRVRSALTSAFGRRIRLSGIRDPRRRWPTVIRFVDTALFAMHYASPKYLNLEASDADWKARLWRTLAESRGAVIDVSDLTTYVVDELHLCSRTLGLDRILFVGDTSKEADEWQASIASELGVPVDAIRVAVWGESRERRKAFEHAAAEFARALPAEPRGLHPAGTELAFLSSDLDRSLDSNTGGQWLELIFGFVLSATLSFVLQILMKLGPIGVIAAFFALAFYLLQWRFFLGYLVQCASTRERVLATFTVGLSLVALPLVGTLPAIFKVRNAAARMQMTNDLKLIGLAFQNYETSNGSFPSPESVRVEEFAVGRRPPISWRVQLLPYLGYENLYREYRLDQPWDSPDNLRLLEKMPKVYRHLSPESNLPVGHTYYRVFITPRNAGEPSALFRRGRPERSLIGIQDGASNTILVVEASEAVPWTKPEGLEYDASQPVPKLGGRFTGKTLAVFADGSVHQLDSNLPEPTLRALITANGGEVIK